MAEKQHFAEEVNGKYFSELPEKLQKAFKSTVVQLSTIRPKKRSGRYYVEKTTTNITTEQLKDMVESGELTLPIFQRGKVWDNKKKSELIYTLLIGGVIPEIIVYEGEGGNKYLIDGWQRTSTIVDYQNNTFKLRLDPNVEHIDPAKTDTQELLKNLFERINYKSTPLSKYRVVILTIYTLSEVKKKKEREALERKIALIQETARRIKEEDRQENNLGFVLRVLTGIRTYELMEKEPERLEEIKTNLRSRNYTDYAIAVLKDWIREIDENTLANVLERTYDLAYVITGGKVSPIASPQGQRNAEAIALVLYEMMKKQADGKPLIEKDLLEGDVDTDKLQEVIELLKAEEDEALQKTGRKNPTATKDYRMYLTATEELFKIKDLIRWEEIFPSAKIEELREGEEKETPEGETPEEDKGEQNPEGEGVEVPIELPEAEGEKKEDNFDFLGKV